MLGFVMFIHDSACVYGCETERRSGLLLCQDLPRLPISDQLRCAGEININLVSICVVKHSEKDIFTAHIEYSLLFASGRSKGFIGKNLGTR